jgi:hypothetical protein
MKNVLLVMHGVMIMITVIMLSSCGSSFTVKKYTNVGWGGRALAADVDPDDPQDIWVATNGGGVFNTGVGGTAWGQMAGLPEFVCTAVKMYPLDHNLIYASCVEDTRAVNGGGLWVSTDGGTTWSQPPGTQKLDNNGNVLPNSAYGIAFQIHPRLGSRPTYSVIVGTDFGLLYSEDGQTNWKYINPQSDGSPNAIYSILALSNGRVITFGTLGVWMSDANLENWYEDQNQLRLIWQSPYCDMLAVSPVSNDQLFLTTDDPSGNGLYYSMNGGKNWLQIPSDFSVIYPKNGSGRGSFVRIAPAGTGDPNQFNLFYGNYANIFKSTLEWNVNGYYQFGGWSIVKTLHTDNSDMLILPDNKTMYVTNDGGVERSLDGGLTWTKLGLASAGFDALQIYDAKIFLAPNYTQNDLYFGTQDNNLYGSPDNGVSWPTAALARPEGGVFQGQVFKSTDYTLSYLLSQGQSRSGPLFDHPKGGYLSSKVDYKSFVYYVRDKTFTTAGLNLSSGKMEYDLYASSNDGKVTFLSPAILTLGQEPLDYFKLSGPSANPTLFVPFLGGSGLGLLRIENAFDGVLGNETISPVPMPPNSEPGIYGAEYVSDLVTYGVDPYDPNFLILAAPASAMVFISSDGGANWTSRPDIASAITQNGKYLFVPKNDDAIPLDQYQEQVTAIQFDPTNSEHILIGTVQAGAVYSDDHGANWYNIPGSESIPNITSFCFNQIQGEEAIVSSWGRGLWTMGLSISGLQSSGMKLKKQPNGKKSAMVNETIPGDRIRALQLYQDTLSPIILFRDSSSVNSRIARAGNSLDILGSRWFGKGISASLEIYIDNHLVKNPVINLAETGLLNVKLMSRFATGRHLLHILQYDHNKNKKEISRNFTIVPGSEND